MDPLHNPFAPGAGTRPPELAGREDVLEMARIAIGRTALGNSAQSLILTGLRGVGKTVLLNRIKELAKQEGHIATLAEVSEQKSLPALLIPTLRSILLKLDRNFGNGEKTKRALRVLQSFLSKFSARFKLNEIAEIELGVSPETGTADSGDLENDLGDLLIAVAQAAKEKKTCICLLIDELQYLREEELSALTISLHRINQEQLPLIMVGAGLPLIVGLSGKAKSYAERLFQFPSIGTLDEKQAKRALWTPTNALGVIFETEALSEIFHKTEGYPYFLQQWGYEAWNVAKYSPITLADVQIATEEAIRRLDQSFFKVRFDRLTPREKQYLYAMLEVGGSQARSGEIAEQLGLKQKSAGPLRSGLIRKGMIYSPSHGDTAFTVPLFGDFLHRQRPSNIS